MKKNSGLLKVVIAAAALVIAHFISNWLMLALIILLIAFLIYSKRDYYYYSKAIKCYSKRDFSESIKWLEKAYSLKKCSKKIKMLYGFLLLRDRQLDKAEEVITPLLNENINNDERLKLKSYLALIIWQRGNLDEAILRFEEILKGFKTTIIYSNLGYLLLIKGDIERAYDVNLEAYEFNDLDFGVMDNLGCTYYYREEYEKAKGIYEKLIPKNPQFPDAYYNYALVSLSLGDKEKALDLMNKALDYTTNKLSVLTKEKVEEKIKEIEEMEEVKKEQ
ncbi:MAG: tetratricopeptide repeat protein [Bacillota bacterium]|nr:tetratricopeptide repeat protein [Bacillota bacterium]